MQRVLVLSNRYFDYTNKDGERVTGRSIRFIESRLVDGKPYYFSDSDKSKVWIRPDNPDLMKIAADIVPGQLIDLIYVVEGKKAVFSSIQPTDELAVDFDSIFNKGG